jgi:serine/threonine protein kinase
MGCTQSAGNQVYNPVSNPVADAPKNSLPHTLQARYKLGEQIGEGGYSIVRVGTSNIDKKKVAVKIVKRQGLTQEDEESLRSEVDILLRLRHPNIVQAFDFFEEVPQFNVILEYIDGGELFDRIVKKTFYNEKEARDLVCIVLSAIKYLHDKNIVHRDLKPENLLLTSKLDDANIKIADFGFATKVEGLSLTTQLGTPGYIAPEILSKKPYGKPVDLWSFGVILYILLGGYPPFHDENQKRLFNKIRNGDFQFHPEYWGGVSEEAKNLIRGLLTVDMKQRLTVDQALAHPWLKRSAEDLAAHNLDSNLAELRKYQATKKFRAGVKAVMAINRMKNLINYDPDEDGN